MTYTQWVEQVPAVIKADVLWKVEAYRLSLFLSDLAWEDVTKLMRDLRTREISDQLCRATGKISAHVAEGFSRGTGRERARYYEYALGSTRESRDWYYKARHILGPEVTTSRLELTTMIAKLALATLRSERRRNMRFVSND